VLIGVRNVAAQEMPVTTKSKEALKLYLEAYAKGQNWHREEAHQLFAQAIALDPDFALAHLYFAESAADPKVLQDELKKALALAPRVSKGEQLFIAADQAWFLENDHVKGTELFRQIAEMYPNSARSETWLGMCYDEREDKDKAIAQYNKALALDKNYAPAHYSLAYTYVSKGDFGKAEEHFKAYRDLAPQEPNPYDCLGDLYMKMGRFDDAISHYGQAVKLDPHFALSQSKIGSSYILKGQYEEGRQALEKAKTMELAPPNKVTDEEGIVRSYIYAGDYKKALEASDAAIRLARELGLPGEAAVLYLGKGAIYCELKNYSAAAMSIADCLKCLADPAVPPDAKQNAEVGSFFWEVFMAAERKDFAGAETKLAEMKAATAKFKEPLFSRYAEDAGGFILLAKGDYAGADAQFAKANVDEPFYLYYAAVAKEKAGDAAGAKKLYARVANWNEDSLWYAFVRNKAKAKV
jgi:tetratricopeptide (TPR) repeat protein